MKQKKNNKYPDEIPLDDYERELEAFLDKGKYSSDKNFKETKKMLEEAAKRHQELRRSKRITLRVNNQDLIKVKARAKRASIPYQRLIGALIHKFAEGQTKVEV
jgi:predicted DNA binding CopG/RHH family protein